MLKSVPVSNQYKAIKVQFDAFDGAWTQADLITSQALYPLHYAARLNISSKLIV